MMTNLIMYFTCIKNGKKIMFYPPYMQASIYYSLYMSTENIWFPNVHSVYV